MKQRYFVTYDVCDPKRLRKVFKCLKGYGQHLQLSVFRCDLTRMELACLKGDLLDVIDSEDDQVLLVDVGPAEGRATEAFETLGRPNTATERGPVVV